MSTCSVIGATAGEDAGDSIEGVGTAASVEGVVVLLQDRGS